MPATAPNIKISNNYNQAVKDPFRVEVTSSQPPSLPTRKGKKSRFEVVEKDFVSMDLLNSRRPQGSSAPTFCPVLQGPRVYLWKIVLIFQQFPDLE